MSWSWAEGVVVLGAGWTLPSCPLGMGWFSVLRMLPWSEEHRGSEHWRLSSVGPMEFSGDSTSGGVSPALGLSSCGWPQLCLNCVMSHAEGLPNDERWARLCVLQVRGFAFLWELARWHFSMSPPLPWVVALLNQKDRWLHQGVKHTLRLATGVSCHWGLDSPEVPKEETTPETPEESLVWSLSSLSHGHRGSHLVVFPCTPNYHLLVVKMKWKEKNPPTLWSLLAVSGHSTVPGAVEWLCRKPWEPRLIPEMAT